MRNKKTGKFKLFVFLELTFTLLLICIGFFDITLFTREVFGGFFAFILQTLGYIVVFVILSIGTYFYVPKFYRNIKFNEINIAIAIMCISNTLMMIVMIVLKITVLPSYRLDRIIWMTIFNILRILITNGLGYSEGKEFCRNCHACFSTHGTKIKEIGSPETRIVNYKKYEKVGEINGESETEVEIPYEYTKAKATTTINADIMGYVNHSREETRRTYRYRVICDNCGYIFYFDNDEIKHTNYK